MSAQVETSASILDVVKQVFSVVLVVAGVAAFYYFSGLPLLYRVLGLVIIAAIVAGMMFTTGVGRTVWGFVLESRQEVRKVVWPTREETFRTTLLVFAMVVIVGFVLWLLDMFLFWGVRFLTGQGG